MFNVLNIRIKKILIKETYPQF